MISTKRTKSWFKPRIGEPGTDVGYEHETEGNTEFATRDDVPQELFSKLRELAALHDNAIRHHESGRAAQMLTEAESLKRAAREKRIRFAPTAIDGEYIITVCSSRNELLACSPDDAAKEYEQKFRRRQGT